MIKYKKPRGTKDIYGLEMDVMQYVKRTVFGILEQHGYTEIRTPVFESSDLYLRGVGEDTDIVNKEMYTFEDKSRKKYNIKTRRNNWSYKGIYRRRDGKQVSKTIKIYVRIFCI